MDREKLIKQIEKCINDSSCIGCPFEKSLLCRHYMLADALAMLKKQEEQKFFVDESGKITPLPVVVRCKDCKYCFAEGFVREHNICDKHEGIQGQPDDWFCADGERKEGQ